MISDYPVMTAGDDLAVAANTLIRERFVPAFSLQKISGGTKMLMQNPMFLKVSMHEQDISSRLAACGFALEIDKLEGYAIVRDMGEARRWSRALTDVQICILIVLAKLYYAETERVRNSAKTDVGELLRQVQGVYRMSVKVTQGTLTEALSVFESFHIIEREKGQFSSNDCSFWIYPTISSIVDSDFVDRYDSAFHRDDEFERRSEEEPVEEPEDESEGRLDDQEA